MCFSNEYTIVQYKWITGLFTQDFQKKCLNALDIPRNGSQHQENITITTHHQELKVDPFDVIAGAGHDTVPAVPCTIWTWKGQFLGLFTHVVLGRCRNRIWRAFQTDEAFKSLRTYNEGCFLDGTVASYKTRQNVDYSITTWLAFAGKKLWRNGHISRRSNGQRKPDSSNESAASPGGWNKIKNGKKCGQKVSQTKGRSNCKCSRKSLALTYLGNNTTRTLTNNEMTTVQWSAEASKQIASLKLTADFYRT